MEYKSCFIFVGFFCAMFFLQIWVAHAQSSRSLSEQNPLVIKVMSKIAHDPDIRRQMGFKPVEKREQQTKKNVSRNVDKEVKKQEEIVWYKPWTWFK